MLAGGVLAGIVPNYFALGTISACYINSGESLSIAGEKSF